MLLQLFYLRWILRVYSENNIVGAAYQVNGRDSIVVSSFFLRIQIFRDWVIIDLVIDSVVYFGNWFHFNKTHAVVACLYNRPAVALSTQVLGSVDSENNVDI